MKTILLKPKKLNKVAIVDDQDYTRLAPYAWYASIKPAGVGAAFRWLTDHFGAHRHNMHEEVLQFESGRGLVIDHINGNPLDNRSENLRICTPLQNRWNSRPHRNNTGSKYKGVSYHYNRPKNNGQRSTAPRPWRVRVQKKDYGRIGASFADEHEAYRKSQQLLKELHGEYAYLVPWTGYSNPKHPNKPINYIPESDH